MRGCTVGAGDGNHPNDAFSSSYTITENGYVFITMYQYIGSVTNCSVLKNGESQKISSNRTFFKVAKGDIIKTSVYGYNSGNRYRYCYWELTEFY